MIVRVAQDVLVPMFRCAACDLPAFRIVTAENVGRGVGQIALCEACLGEIVGTRPPVKPAWATEQSSGGTDE